MKEITRYQVFFIMLLLSMSTLSCRRQLGELYNDPDQAADASIPRLLTQILNNSRMRPSYWEIRTFVTLHTGVYGQTVGYLNRLTTYQQNASYTSDRWSDFYRPGPNGAGTMVHYRSMEAAWNKLSQPEDQKQQEVFLAAARVILLDQGTQMVDLWGDIPFFNAGILGATGQLEYAKFDDALSIYRYALEQLRTLAGLFNSVQINTATQTTFTQQDILLGGSLQRWRQYANALRLRLLMRLAEYDPAGSRNEVLEILQNPGLYPLPDGGSVYDPARDDVLLVPLANYEDNLYAALRELNNLSAPHYLLDSVMNPSNDPRIPVMFDKYGRLVNGDFVPNSTYRGLPINLQAPEQQPVMGSYAIMDSATFLFNRALPGILFTASEVNFLAAEAFIRWGGGDAVSRYEKALRQSIRFYYYLNSLNTATRPPLPFPTTETIDAFLLDTHIRLDAVTGSPLEKIAVQKWLHFGFLQSVQAWSEYRRTGFPKLQFLDMPLPGFELPPLRLTYPTSETNDNPNYESVKENDKRDTKIFWQIH